MAAPLLTLISSCRSFVVSCLDFFNQHHSYRTISKSSHAAFIAIGPGFWETSVIGDFTEGEAHEFLQWDLAQSNSSVAEKQIQVEDRQWTEIYKVYCFYFSDIIPVFRIQL